jgi:hypothetical protein
VEQRASRHASSVDEHVGRAAPLALGVGDRLVPEGRVAEVFSGWQEGRTYATEPLIKCTPCGRGSVGALTSSATTRALLDEELDGGLAAGLVSRLREGSLTCPTWRR